MINLTTDRFEVAKLDAKKNKITLPQRSASL